MTEECIKRERFAVSQQIEVDDKTRAERSKMVEKEKAEFFKAGSPQEGNKDPSGTLQNIGSGQPENLTKPEAGKVSPEEHNTECLSKLVS